MTEDYKAQYRNFLNEADGKSREDCILLARQAFGSANRWRAMGLARPHVAESRLQAVKEARWWEDVLYYLDKSGASEFSEEKSRPYQWGKLRSFLEWLKPATWHELFSDALGSKPIAFRDPFKERAEIL